MRGPAKFDITVPKFRICKYCNKKLPLTVHYFYTEKRNSIPFTSICIECDSVKKKRWRQSAIGKLKTESRRQSDIQLRKRILQAYSIDNNIQCNCCGEDFFDFLHLDHIHGDGKEDRAKRGNGIALFRVLEREGYPEKSRYRILCANCNLALVKSHWTFESLKQAIQNRRSIT